jgi:hypothetical protein
LKQFIRVIVAALEFKLIQISFDGRMLIAVQQESVVSCMLVATR